MNMRKRYKELYGERQQIEDKIREHKVTKSACDYHIRKLKKKLIKNEEEILTLLDGAIDIAEANEEAYKQVSFELDERIHGRLGGTND